MTNREPVSLEPILVAFRDVIERIEKLEVDDELRSERERVVEILERLQDLLGFVLPCSGSFFPTWDRSSR